jgi:hypothetical protein
MHRSNLVGELVGAKYAKDMGIILKQYPPNINIPGPTKVYVYWFGIKMYSDEILKALIRL